MRTNGPKSRRKKAKFDGFSILCGLSDDITMVTQKTPRFLVQKRGETGRIWDQTGQNRAKRGQKGPKVICFFGPKWGVLGSKKDVFFRSKKIDLNRPKATKSDPFANASVGGENWGKTGGKTGGKNRGQTGGKPGGKGTGLLLPASGVCDDFTRCE